MIKVGIIGFGKMGKIRFDALSKIKGVEILSVFDPNNKSKNVNVDNLDEILKNENIDAVFICTPNFLNKDLTIKCLLEKKHVFCEKPPAFTSN